MNDWRSHHCLQWLKEILSHLGIFIKDSAAFDFLTNRYCFFENYLGARVWMRAHRFKNYQVLKDRWKVLDHICRSMTEPTIVCEFGVFEGESLRYIANQLSDSHSQFFGFDSFDGLPSDWNPQNPRGTFSLGGKIPTFTDLRIQILKGYFSDSLKNFALPEKRGPLILHIDCDLYSSAREVLEWSKSRLRAGDFILFDEFYDAQNERKAFGEFLKSSDFNFKCIAVSLGHAQALFEIY